MTYSSEPISVYVEKRCHRQMRREKVFAVSLFISYCTAFAVSYTILALKFAVVIANCYAEVGSLYGPICYSLHEMRS